MHRLRQQNSTTYAIPIYLVSSTDHVTPVSGVTPTVSLRKNLAAAGAATGTAAASDSAGVSKFSQSSTDANTLGSWIIEATGTGCDPYTAEYTIVAYDPFNVLPTANAGSNNGLPLAGSQIPNAVAGGAGGLPLLTGSSYLQVEVLEWAGVGVTNGASNNPLVDLSTLYTLTINSDGSVQATDSAGNTVASATSLAAVATNAATAAADGNLFLTRLTAARAGYLDNLNVGGAVASHADVNAINQSASKHLLLQCVGQFEPGETYTIEMRTFAAADGSAVNADTTPTLTATGNVSGSLSANLSAATNVSTGLYRWTYTPGATPTLEQIRFDGSATIATAAFTLSCYSQTVDFATAVFTATDQSHLTSIYNKLPAASIGDATASSQTAIKAKTDLIGTNSADSPNEVTAQTAIANIASGTMVVRANNSAGATIPAGTAQTGDGYAYLTANLGATGSALRLAKGTQITGLNDIPAGSQMDLVNAPNATAITAIQSGLATATNLAALAGKLTGITSLGNWLRAFFRKDSPDATALSEINATTNGIAGTWDSTLYSEQVLASRYNARGAMSGSNWIDSATCLENAPAGGGGGGGGATVQEIVDALAGQSLTVINPVANNSVSIKAGRAYKAAYGNALVFPRPPAANWPADFTGWTIVFTATRTQYNTGTDGPYAWAMTAPVASGSGQELQLELASTDTANLTAGQGTKGYLFQITGTPPASTDTVDLLDGLMSVD